jgi:hypothetical protein
VEHLELDVTLLDLDCGNPRHGEVADQAAALAALMADQGQKLVNLALDIHLNGLSPAHRFIVIEKANGRYTVLDGNRRLAALRILVNPSILVPAYRPAGFVEKASELGNRPQAVSCTLMADREAAAIWLERTHTGQLEGVGVIPWSPVAQHRFRPKAKRTQTSSAVAVLDWLRQRTTNEAKLQHISKVEEVASTNLGRLMTDKTVRKLIGFNFEGHEIVADAPEEDLDRRFSAVVTDLSKDRAVTDLTHRKDREDHIRGLLGEDIHPTSTGKQLELDPSADTDQTAARKEQGTETPENEPVESGGIPSDRPEPQTPTAKAPRRTTPRLFQSLQAPGLHSRTKAIIIELQQLDLGRFPNAAAVLLRSAVELSVVEYLEAAGEDLDSMPKLATRIKRAMDHLQPSKDRNRYHGIKTELGKPNSLLAAQNLNQYVHNHHHPPLADELETISTRYSTLLEDISTALSASTSP